MFTRFQPSARTTGENTEESARVPDDFTSAAGKRDFSSIQKGKATSYDRARNCRRKRDASRQRRREEHEAAATAAVEERLEAKEKEREEEQEMLAANWLAFSAPADVETDEVKQPQVAPDVASEEAFLDSEPFNISSDDSDGESCRPRRSGRVKKPSRAIQSQQEKIELGLIPAPGARAKARALNAKKKKNIEVSQLEDEFELIE